MTTAYLMASLQALLFIQSGCIGDRPSEPSYFTPSPSPRPTRTFTPAPTPTPTVSPSPSPSPTLSPSPSPSPSQSPAPLFTVRGTITYDFVPAQDGVNEPGPKLNYTAKATRPARRMSVQALESGTVTVLTEAATNDLGQYTLNIPLGKTIKVRVRSVLQKTNYQNDGIAPEFCRGASWDIRAVDNTSSKAIYVMDSPSAYSANSNDANIHAPLTLSGSTYSNRAAAPFALLDTVVSSLETACQGRANLAFPLLYINWSPNNAAVSGNKAIGQISTSHFTVENNIANLYILGKENADTDEFDDHVVAHELGHYLEEFLYRSDTIGGPHSIGDSLDPRVAFSEGFGNAFSGMAFNDPYYVDTMGSAQSGGFVIRVHQAPTGDNRGVYSESSCQFLLWSLFENRDSTANHGQFDRIHNILENFQKTSSALTTLQTFASYYNQVYGGLAESFQVLWNNSLDLPYGSLCSNGSCTGSGDVADPFDLDNDIGWRICSNCASPRRYPQSSGSTFGTEFWMLYRALQFGSNYPTAHDQTQLASYSWVENKFGGVRWYFVVGTGGVVRVSVNNLGGGADCEDDILDMYVYKKGNIVAQNEDAEGSTAGCPSVSFATTAGEVYVITVNAYAQETRVSIPSWVVTVY